MLQAVTVIIPFQHSFGEDRGEQRNQPEGVSFQQSSGGMFRRGRQACAPGFDEHQENQEEDTGDRTPDGQKRKLESQREPDGLLPTRGRRELFDPAFKKSSQAEPAEDERRRLPAVELAEL